MQELDTDSVVDAAPASEIEESLVDVGAAHRDSNLEEILNELDRELVGLMPVKDYLRRLASLLLVTRLREKVGLSNERPTLHMSFTGHPGTGKTTVAMRMAKILHHLGYLRRGHLVVATRDDLVGQYVGHTAPKTKEILKKAMGGVLFIDEAYYLYRPENERDYGQEAVEMLLQAMENQREDLVVILAGYQDRMATFFHHNPGFRSRVAHHISFPNYTLEELTTIAELMLREQNYSFDNDARKAFVEYLELRTKQPQFANARSVRNAIDRIKLRQANRLVNAGGRIHKEQLVHIAAIDVRQSRVFQGGLGGEDEPGTTNGARPTPHQGKVGP
ncbi:MAG TPA: CbbX protein [Verrucomicrobiae bacterium]|nr:CbbX protein [Verrucomicrobiae bacterium]